MNQHPFGGLASPEVERFGYSDLLVVSPIFKPIGMGGDP
jgi:hypothetical protein